MNLVIDVKWLKIINNNDRALQLNGFEFHL